MEILKKLGIKLPYDPTVPILGIHPEKTIIEKEPVFTAALFAIARRWKQPRCPPTGEWIKKLRYKHTRECDSAVRRNASESV